MWFEAPHGTWFIGEREGDASTHVACFPSAQKWLVTVPQELTATLQDSEAKADITIQARPFDSKHFNLSSHISVHMRWFRFTGVFFHMNTVPCWKCCSN